MEGQFIGLDAVYGLNIYSTSIWTEIVFQSEMSVLKIFKFDVNIAFGVHPFAISRLRAAMRSCPIFALISYLIISFRQRAKTALLSYLNTNCHSSLQYKRN